MKPIRIAAFIENGIANPTRSIAIDALLAYAVALRDDLPPPANASELVPIEIPLQRSPCGRFHLCSLSEHDAVAERETRYVNRRPIIAEAQLMASESVKSIQINGGPDKGYRVPMEVGHYAKGELWWWAIGRADDVRTLLDGHISHLGKRRAVGLGKVTRWLVEECESWGENYPVMREGRPLRALPPEWPGCEAMPTTRATLSYPYWLREAYESVVQP